MAWRPLWYRVIGRRTINIFGSPHSASSGEPSFLSPFATLPHLYPTFPPITYKFPTLFPPTPHAIVKSEVATWLNNPAQVAAQRSHNPLKTTTTGFASPRRDVSAHSLWRAKRGRASRP